MTLYNWSKTAASNSTADATVNWAEGQAPSSVNDSARAMMAAVAKWRDDNSGSLTTGGTSTAYTLTTNQVFSSLTVLNGQSLRFKMSVTNGASPTLAVDGLTAKALHTITGTAVGTGTLVANSIVTVVYDNSNACFVVVGSAFPSVPAGTLMLFQQTAAPTGWTKQSTHNDKALRVVTGSASSGGSSAFSTVFAKTATDSYTLTTTDIPSHTHTGTTGAQSAFHQHTATTDSGGAHTHTVSGGTQGGTGSAGLASGGINAPTSASGVVVDSGGAHTHTLTTGNDNATHTHDFTSNATGSGGGHTHGMDIRVQYVDVIIAAKD